MGDSRDQPLGQRDRLQACSVRLHLAHRDLLLEQFLLQEEEFDFIEHWEVVANDQKFIGGEVDRFHAMGDVAIAIKAKEFPDMSEGEGDSRDDVVAIDDSEKLGTVVESHVLREGAASHRWLTKRIDAPDGMAPPPFSGGNCRQRTP